MARILRLYVIREILTPTVMALVTITLMLIMREIYQLVDLIMQPGVSLRQVLGVMGSLLPSVLIFCAPMAILIGVIIGVGRMVLDREILAMRASGLNLLSVFAPTLGLAAVASLLILFLSATYIPHTIVRMLNHLEDLTRAVITSLEPGRFYESDKLGLGKGAKDEFILYFREYEPDRQGMRGIVLKLEADNLNLLDEQNFGRPGEESEQTNPLPVSDAMFPADLTGEERAYAAELAAAGRDHDLTTVFASSGRIDVGIRDSESDGAKKLSLLLTLKNGSMHQKSADSTNPQYITSQFEDFEMFQMREAAIQKEARALTNLELRSDLQGWAGSAMREIVDRQARGWAFFVFTLIGIPLAIRTRLGGKSWAILLAIMLMLVYFVLMQMGLTMIDNGKPLGIAVAFLPNLLFLMVGVVLWWQTLRS